MVKRNKQRGPHQDPVPHQPAYTSEFNEDLAYWQTKDPKVAARLLRLVRETLQSPFRGIGKPEPLKHRYDGAWSRRLTSEHRLVYRVEASTVIFMAARLHY